MRTTIIELIILLCFTVSNANAINEYNGVNFSIPTPNAQDMCRYGTIPMNYYTGRANVSVPIYSTEQGGVPLQISLTYDTGGLLINRVPGWVGENWSLNVGGCITRTVCGGQDDDIDHSFKTNEYGAANYFDNEQDWESLIVNGDNYNITNNLLDYNPDIFSFSFMGKSGRFFLGADKKWKIQSDDNLKIVFDYTNEDNYAYPFIQRFYDSNKKGQRTIKGFTIIDDNGIKYIFGGTTDAIEYSIPLLAMNDLVQAQWTADSWYLSEVQDRFGNVLYKFKYQRGKFAAQVAYNEVSMGAMASWNGGSNSFQYLQQVSDTRAFPYSITINAPVFVKEIEIVDKTKINFSLSKDVTRSPKNDFLPTLDYYCQKILIDKYINKTSNDSPEMTYLETLTRQGSNGINFYYLQRVDTAITRYWSDKYQSNLNGYYSIRKPDDKPNPLVVLEYSPLEKICITKGNNVYQSYKLMYDESKRIHLKELRLYRGSEIEYKYSFDYMDYDKLTDIDYMTKKIDYWGYYNADENSYDANSKVSAYGMLKKITYPTGGSTVFEYEQNNYSSYQNADRTAMIQKDGVCGGIRIKSISNYDSNNTRIQKRSYVYCIPGGTKSSGQCFSEPLKSIGFTLKEGYNSYAVGMSSKMSLIPMANSFGPHIGYSWVKEILDDGTSNIFHFSNISDYPDEPPVYSSQNEFTPSKKYNELGFTRGKLLEQITYDKSGRKMHSVQNKYRTDYKDDYSYAVQKTTYSMFRFTSAYNFFLSYIYKIYYSKFSLDTTIVTQYFNNDSLKDVTTYEYDDYNCGGTIIRKSKAVKVDRMSGDSVFTNGYKTYTYPHGVSYFDDSFFFPVTSETSYSNGNITQILNNNYKTLTIREKTVPVLDYQTIQVGNGPQKKSIEYLSYDSNGQLIKYRELGEAVTRLFWSTSIFNRLEAIVKGNTNSDNVCISANLGPILYGKSLFANPNFKVEWYRYNNLGLLDSKTISNGYTEKYEYDQLGRLTAVYHLIKDASIVSPYDSGCTKELLRKYSYNYINK